ncbi:MAG TPA: bifunctional metallophosphatase/5'-nucleotidase [Gemmatimonadales bacterium]|nr:bifunctional metallophosphatase/5'-nucleotidase [Gemmatimonadales bacterium]
MRRLSLFVLALAAACGQEPTAPVAGGAASLADGRAARGEVDFCLTLLHNNDGESDLINAGDGALASYGGAARFATLVDRLRSAAESEDAAVAAAVACDRTGLGKRAALVVSSGDNFLASPEFNASLARGTPFYDGLALDLIGYDALAIGNHEFDFGPDVLADFIESLPATEAPFLSANLDVAGEPRLAALASAGRIARSIVVKKRGESLGIIGATTPLLPAISSPRNAVASQLVAQAINDEVAALESRGVNKIVVISHLQSLAEDLALIPSLRGVDIVVAGGGDNLLANPGTLLLPGAASQGAYPTLATDATGRRVLVVTTEGGYRYVGRLIAGFDKAGEIVTWNEGSGPVRVSGVAPDAVPADAEVQAQVVDPVAAYVQALEQNVIAQSAVALDGRRSPGVRTQETNLGSLVADAILWQARQRAAQFGQPQPHVGIQNGGGIRNNSLIPAGPLTEKTTFDVLPFANFVSIVPDVPRAQFKEILENAVSRVAFADGRFAQVAGFRFSWSATGTAQVVTNDGVVTTAGDRVRDVVLDDGTVIVQDGVVVPGAPISIATIDFSARGGDQYPFRGAPFATVGVTYQLAFLNYLTQALGGQVTSAQYPEAGSGRITPLP